MRIERNIDFFKDSLLPYQVRVFDVIKISASLMQRMKKRSLLETRSKLTF